MQTSCVFCARTATVAFSHASTGTLPCCFLHATALYVPIAGKEPKLYLPTTTLWGQQLSDMMDAAGIKAPREMAGGLWDVGIPRLNMSLVTYSRQVLGDIGNGCSYRCAQMILHALFPDEMPLDIEVVLEGMGVSREQNGKIPWKEPKNIGSYLANKFKIGGSHGMISLVGVPSDNLGGAKTRKEYTTEEKRVVTLPDLEIEIQAHFLREGALPIMIDDTLYTYVIYGIRKLGDDASNVEVLIADPHNFSGEPITSLKDNKLLKWHVTSHWFNRGWMIYYPLRPVLTQ